MKFSWRAIILVVTALMTIGMGLWFERPLNEYQYIGDGQAFLPMMTLPGAPGGTLRIEIADEVGERVSGLSRRAGLAPERGMIFLFDTAAIYPFWMKDMRFPIDIIYLHDGVVTQIFANVPPPGPGEEPKTVEPSVFSNAVLELSAGEAARREIAPGTYFQGLPSLR